MIKKILNVHSWFFITIFTSLVKISSLFKVSFVVGSTAAFFSATPIVQPLAGVWGGVVGSSLVFLLSAILRMFIGGWSPFILLAYHIPGLCASLALASRHWALHLALPALCMLVFIVHPVGLSAFPYAFYWFIPMILYVAGKEIFFLRALSSTFIAHAVGSAVWIWARPMTLQAWVALIPVVIIERIIFALGMTLIYLTVKSVQKYIQKTAVKGAISILEVAE